MRMFGLHNLIVVGLALAAGLLPESSLASVLIRNVSILDGSGQPAFAGAVRIRGDRIVAVGELRALPGDSEVDGRGLTLAPGFIDTHSHADRDIFEQPDALPAVSQGITTIVVGQDGGSPFPLADFFDKLASQPVALNIAAYAGHNRLRREVMGGDYRRAATDAEVARMRELLEAEMVSGALGLSTGLEYEPGIWSASDEVASLARVAARHSGRYISHIRSEDRWFEDALEEIIAIGRDTGMPVQVSHIKLAMRRLWGSADDVIARLDRARAEGVNISADIYPYEYWQSNLMVLLPSKDWTNRQEAEEALDEVAPPDGIWFTEYQPQPEYVGMSLSEVAERMETDPVTAFMQLTEASERMEERTGSGADSIIGTSMREDDIATLLQWEHSNICTDGAFDDLHPRARGAFPRVLGRFVRERGVLTLPEAVHRMTALAATHMGMSDRGLIRPGFVADLVLFDPARIIDNATPEDPGLLASGVAGVWVSGERVYDSGHATGHRPGRVIRRAATAE